MESSIPALGRKYPDSQSNFNYSRSLLFSLGEPLYHLGLRASIPLTKKFTVGAQLLNGWNDVADNNTGKTGGLTTALTLSKWSWSQAYLIGPEKNNNNSGQRQLVNEVFTYSPKPVMQAYFEALYGRDKRVGANSGADAWYGLAVATRFNLSKKLSLAPRLEYYNDQTGFTSGTPQHLREVTTTAEYKWLPNVLTRLEFRDDVSNRNVFDHGNGAKGKQQGAVIAALLISLKGER